MASERGDAESRSHAGDLGHSYRLLYVADARLSVGNHRADDRELEPDRPTMKAMKLAGNVNEAAVVQRGQLLCRVRVEDRSVAFDSRDGKRSRCWDSLGSSIDRGAWTSSSFRTISRRAFLFSFCRTAPTCRQPRWPLVAATANTNVARSAFYPQLSSRR